MHQNGIIARVNKLYSKTEKKGKALSEFHCDYLKLENVMKFYNKTARRISFLRAILFVILFYQAYVQLCHPYQIGPENA